MPYCYVSNTGSSSVSVIDTGSDAVVSTISLAGEPGPLTVSPDGTQAYVSYSVRTDGYSYHVYVAVINTTSNEISKIFDLGDYAFPPNNIFAPNDTSLYVAIGLDYGNSTQYYVIPIDTQHNTVAEVIPALGPDPFPMIASADGTHLYVGPTGPSGSASDPACITVIDIAANTVMPQSYSLPYFMAYGGTPMRMVNQPNTTNILYAIVTGGYDQIVVIDTFSIRTLCDMPISSSSAMLQGIVFSLDGRYAYVANDNPTTISALDTSSTLSSSPVCPNIPNPVDLVNDLPSITFPESEYWIDMVVSPNGKYLYALSQYKLYVIDISVPYSPQLYQAIFMPGDMGPFTDCSYCGNCSGSDCDMCRDCEEGITDYYMDCTGCDLHSYTCSTCAWSKYSSASALAVTPSQKDSGLYDVYISTSYSVFVVDTDFNVSTIAVGIDPRYLAMKPS